MLLRALVDDAVVVIEPREAEVVRRNRPPRLFFLSLFEVATFPHPTILKISCLGTSSLPAWYECGLAVASGKSAFEA